MPPDPLCLGPVFSSSNRGTYVVSEVVSEEEQKFWPPWILAIRVQSQTLSVLRFTRPKHQSLEGQDGQSL